MRHGANINLLSLHGKLRDNLISPSEFATTVLSQSPLQKQKKKLYPDEHFSSEIMQNLNDYHWKGVEDRARRSLVKWHQGLYPLVLLHHIPTPLEVLHVQGTGHRVVTVFLRDEEWASLHHGKTAWDFTLHDLIHADHFFEKPEWREGQILFYQFLLKNWQHPVLSQLHTDPQFEYLIADMNTHPQHLFQTLQALVLKSWKLSMGIELSQVLPADEERAFQSLISDWRSELALSLSPLRSPGVSVTV